MHRASSNVVQLLNRKPTHLCVTSNTCRYVYIYMYIYIYNIQIHTRTRTHGWLTLPSPFSSLFVFLLAFHWECFTSAIAGLQSRTVVGRRCLEGRFRSGRTMCVCVFFELFKKNKKNADCRGHTKTPTPHKKKKKGKQKKKRTGSL